MLIKIIDPKKLQIGMFLVTPIYRELNEKRYMLIPGNTLITNKLQLKKVLDSGAKSVEIDTDKGIDAFPSDFETNKMEDLLKSCKNSETTEAILSRNYNNFTASVSSCVLKDIACRSLISDEPLIDLFREVILFIENHVEILLALVRLKNTNEFTFSHSICTSILCMSVANSLKLNYVDIKRFGIAVMLADIGMANYPSKIILRPSVLTRTESEEVKKHPLYSLNFLKENDITDPLIEKVVVQHHERFDGSGYPYGLKSEEIHPLSKLFTLADVYCAMTSPRPHRQAYSPHLVLADFLNMSATLFEPKMTEMFIRHIGIFPISNLVELTTGQLALVAGLNRNDPLKPPVIILKTMKKPGAPHSAGSSDEKNIIIDKAKFDFVDLSDPSNSNGRIRRGLDHRKYGINPRQYLSQI